MLRYAGLMLMGVVAGSMTGMGWAAGIPATAEIFAPGVISGPADDEGGAFTPDGKTVYFFRTNSSDEDIMVAHLDGKAWSSPR
jgi:hypothetical protein